MAVRFAPLPQAVLEFPTRPEDMANGRLHNRFAKESLREAMAWLHATTMARRFEPGASGRYGYAQRTPKYLARKRRKFGHSTDLVYTGKTRDRMKRTYQTRIGGTGEGGDLKASLVMTFPFAEAARAMAKARAAKSGKSAKIIRNARTAQLAKELSTFTDKEVKDTSEFFNIQYAEKVGAWRGRRRRIRMKTG